MKQASATPYQRISSPMVSPSTTWVSGATAWPRLARTVRRPVAARSAATGAKRSGWRGTSTSSVSGAFARWRWKAASKASSSPACVLPAVSTGRAPSSWRVSAMAWCSAGPACTSDLMLPVMHRRSGVTPSACSRAALAASSAHTRRRLASAGVMRRFQRWYPAAERSERRALTSATGMPRHWAWCRNSGHSSRSISSTARGCHCCRKRRVAPGVSTGNSTCVTRAPKSLAICRAPVGVVQLSTTGPQRGSASSRCTSGRAAITSPTEAQCSSTPWRADASPLARPRRSAQRSR